MGTPLPPTPPDPGDLCNVCWGDSGPIGIVTPRVISITLYKLEEGAFWNEIYRDELFTPTELIQDAITPCFFAQVTANFTWILLYDVTGTVIQVEENFFGGKKAFDIADPTLCVTSGPNALVIAAGNVAFNGSMSLYFGSP